MSGKPVDPIKRFWVKVDKSVGLGPKGDCWEWTAGTFTNGYGQFSTGKAKICAHRFSYILEHGDIDDQLKVCHTCDNRKCIRPKHLFLGTQLDNIHDMIQKGRKVNGDLSGIKNGRAKLNEVEVGEIKELYMRQVSIAQMARTYNVGESTVRHIVQGHTWINKGN